MNKNIMIWIQNSDVVKGEIDFTTGTVTFFDKFDNILMRRDGLTFKQLNNIRNQIQKQLANRPHVGFYYV